MSTATSPCRLSVEVVAVLLLLTISACGRTDSPHPEATGVDDVQWAVVREYIDLQAAWEERAGDLPDILFSGDGTVDEIVQRAEQEHGQLPDVTAAVAAAQESVAGGGPHTIEAAEFLIERTSTLSLLVVRHIKTCG